MYTIDKVKLRRIVSESVKKVISNKSLWKDKVFISYGTDKLDLNSVKPIETGKSPLKYRIAVGRNKPYGGLWASPLTSTKGWGEWCSDNGFRLDTLSHHFIFKLSPDANIYVIDTMGDLNDISTMKDEYGRRSMDFHRLSMEFDGVFVTADAVSSLRMHDDMSLSDLYSWDVESLCVWNADVIVPIEEDAFEKAAVKKYEYKEPDEFDYYMGDDDPYSGKRKPLQMQHDMEMYSNQNVHDNMGKFFKKGQHPAILAQGHGNGKETKKARKFDGTLKSGL